MGKWGIILTVIMCLGVGRAQAAFLPETDDIPLMDDITLSETTDFSFDTPAGQILSFDGTTSRSSADVQRFYDEALMALGWQKERANFYRRDKDTIQLSFPKKGQVRFDVMLNGAD